METNLVEKNIVSDEPVKDLDNKKLEEITGKAKKNVKKSFQVSAWIINMFDIIVAIVTLVCIRLMGFEDTKWKDFSPLIPNGMSAIKKAVPVLIQCGDMLTYNIRDRIRKVRVIVPFVILAIVSILLLICGYVFDIKLPIVNISILMFVVIFVVRLYIYGRQCIQICNVIRVAHDMDEMNGETNVDVVTSLLIPLLKENADCTITKAFQSCKTNTYETVIIMAVIYGIIAMVINKKISVTRTIVASIVTPISVLIVLYVLKWVVYASSVKTDFWKYLTAVNAIYPNDIFHNFFNFIVSKPEFSYVLFDKLEKFHIGLWKFIRDRWLITLFPFLAASLFALTIVKLTRPKTKGTKGKKKEDDEPALFMQVYTIALVFLVVFSYLTYIWWG